MEASPAYEEKFAEFIEIIRASRESGIGQVLVAQPWVLGDTYEEIIESLSRIADAKLALTIVSR